MEEENIRRFLRDEAEMAGVLFDAYKICSSSVL